MKEEPLLLLSDLWKLINQVVLIDYIIIILGGSYMKTRYLDTEDPKPEEIRTPEEIVAHMKQKIASV